MNIPLVWLSAAVKQLCNAVIISTSPVAFENSPNQGAVLTNKDGSFEIKVKYPNSYYIDLGRTYVQPVVYIKVCGQKKVHTIKLGNGIPFRSLCHPLQRKGPSFYENDGRNILPPRTQEQLLRDKSYPNKNIWILTLI